MKDTLRPTEKSERKTLPFEELARLDQFEGLAAWFGRRLTGAGLSGEGFLLTPAVDGDEWMLYALQGEGHWRLASGHPLPELLSGLDHDASLEWGDLKGLPSAYSPQGSCRILPLSGRQLRFLGAILIDMDPESARLPGMEGFLAEQRELGSLAGERLLLVRRHQQLVRSTKELEEQKSHFVSTISHELKTPLTSILGFIDLAMTQPSAGEDKVLSQFLEGIRFSAQNLEQLIKEILTMGGMVSAGLEVDIGMHGFPDLLREFKEEHLADIHGHQRIRWVSEPMDLPLKVDRRQFHRILQHLIGNALKFSDPESPVELDWKFLEGQRRSDHNDFLRLDVRDFGAGIGDEDQDKIFTKFYQVDRGNTRKTGGLGVGLTLAKEFTEAMGGRIWVKSRLNEGSTFSVLLPVPRRG